MLGENIIHCHRIQKMSLPFLKFGLLLLKNGCIPLIRLLSYEHSYVNHVNMLPFALNSIWKTNLGVRDIVLIQESLVSEDTESSI